MVLRRAMVNTRGIPHETSCCNASRDDVKDVTVPVIKGNGSQCNAASVVAHAPCPWLQPQRPPRVVVVNRPHGLATPRHT
eukprot:m.185535 g.185535  ORF g.185535 m.185535 type:complete len:80 (-) comp16469_c0_seq1:218-457(-)